MGKWLSAVQDEVGPVDEARTRPSPGDWRSVEEGRPVAQVCPICGCIGEGTRPGGDGHLVCNACEERIVSELGCEENEINEISPPVDNRTERIRIILAEIRPHLPPNLQHLSDEKLLALVNWSMIAAFEKAIREFNP